MRPVSVFRYDSFLSNCYVLDSEDGEGVIVIDPFISEELFDRIANSDPSEVLVVLTHEHFDHTTGVNEIKRRFGAKLVCSKACSERISQKRNNRPLSIMGNARLTELYGKVPLYECSADIVFDGPFELEWHGTELEFTPTPGHTVGSVCIKIGDYAFAGDSALLNERTVTRFPTGDQTDYDGKTVPFLLALDPNTQVMPGHGETYRISEVKWQDGCFRRS